MIHELIRASDSIAISGFIATCAEQENDLILSKGGG